MSFSNTIVSAILIACILELVRHIVGRITKKSDLLKEYRMKLVQKRLEAYENTYRQLENYSYLFSVNINGTEERNSFFNKLDELAKSILQLTFYFSSATEQLFHDIHSLLSVKALGDMDRSTAENFRKDIFTSLGQLTQKMKEEIYSAEIEKNWTKTC